MAARRFEAVVRRRLPETARVRPNKESRARLSYRNLIRVTRQRPCVICSRPDWCGVSANGAFAICMRIESEKRSRNGGYVHRLRESSDWTRGRFIRQIVFTTGLSDGIDFARVASQYSQAVCNGALAHFARTLGVSTDSLSRLRVGHDGDAWTFPMTDAFGQIVGIRRRLHDGRKLSVTGGHEGLFIPVDLPNRGTLYVCEGPTDTAALLALGFAAIGRPSCTGGIRFTIQVCRDRDVVIVSDGDDPGRGGTFTLARRLRLYCPSVRAIQPPSGIKDAREWVLRGAQAVDIMRAVNSAKSVTVSLRITTV